MKLERRALETLTGAGVLALFLVLLLAAHASKSAFEEGYTLRAHFGRIDGLAEGAEVRLAGIRVGSVGRARLDVESNEVIVDLAIDFDVRVPRDSAAKIVSSSLLGGKYVLLSAGGDSDMLLPGDSFEYSQDSVILEQVLARIVEQAERRRALQQEEARASSIQD